MTVSLDNWLRRLPSEMVTSHLNLDAPSIGKIPAEKLSLLKRPGCASRDRSLVLTRGKRASNQGSMPGRRIL